jgi:1,4-dihydroxy-2-naphthoate octaprenyltransferase
MVLLQGGANMTNDYFDHLSGNDWAGEKPTPFSGGSGMIQKGLLSPRAMLTESLVVLAAGAMLGVIIVLITKSVFIIVLGVVGVLGGFFYTSPPLKFAYRTTGEILIAFLFGILPVAGAYYLQAGRVDWIITPAAMIVAILIFMIILINEFADVHQDSSVNKRTLVVRFGVKSSSIIYRSVLVVTYLVAVLSLMFDGPVRYAGAGYLVTMPVGVKTFLLANEKNLTEAKDFRVNAWTVLLHIGGTLAITAGLVVYGLVSKG